MPTAIVSGALANKPWNGGNAWTRISFVLGLRRLGFEVVFVEQIAHASADAIAFFDLVCAQFGLGGRAALLSEGASHGLTLRELADVATDADVLVNIGGHLTVEAFKGPVRRKLYFDDDPGFTQFWHASGDPGARLEGHDAYYTIGENIGRPGCRIPCRGIDWRPARPPLVLDEWPITETGEPDRFTTVASWRGPYGPVEYLGRTFGLKVHQFRRFVGLPQQASQTFEVALEIDASDVRDLRLLRDHGWRIVDPRSVASDPQSFRRYVQSSGAEFSVAKGVYVETRSGWFSDRTVRYMASGKPALVQDTGFSGDLAAGHGLVSFTTMKDAVDGAARIAREYDAHSAAARSLAETHFDSDVVLGRMLEK